MYTQRKGRPGVDDNGISPHDIVSGHGTFRGEDWGCEQRNWRSRDLVSSIFVPENDGSKRVTETVNGRRLVTHSENWRAVVAQELTFYPCYLYSRLFQRHFEVNLICTFHESVTGHIQSITIIDNKELRKIVLRL